MQSRTLAFLLLIAALFNTAASLPAQDDGLSWYDNYKDALGESRRTQKPIFLEYRCEP